MAADLLLSVLGLYMLSCGGGDGGGCGVVLPGGAAYFFAAEDNTRGVDLWRTDGTPQGTFLVKDISPTFRDSFPSNITASGAFVFFSADDGTHGRELWRTDGTAAGTVMLKNIMPSLKPKALQAALIGPSVAGSNPSMLTDGNTLLYFFATDGVHGFEPWRSDGTDAGTFLIMDINPGTNDSSPMQFMVN